jgi:hypothetical protein
MSAWWLVLVFMLGAWVGASMLVFVLAALDRATRDAEAIDALMRSLHDDDDEREPADVIDLELRRRGRSLSQNEYGRRVR